MSADNSGIKVVYKGGQDEIAALVKELNDIRIELNAGITGETALKPDYTEWDKAETAYDALSEEQIANTTAPVVTATALDPTSDVEVIYNKTVFVLATIYNCVLNIRDCCDIFFKFFRENVLTV